MRDDGVVCEAGRPQKHGNSGSPGSSRDPEAINHAGRTELPVIICGSIVDGIDAPVLGGENVDGNRRARNGQGDVTTAWEGLREW
jgi:hypothetical protein